VQYRVSTTTTCLPTHEAAVAGEPGGQLQPINPLTLATLDFGLFRSLRKLGTERERICDALGLSADDFDYIAGLAE